MTNKNIAILIFVTAVGSSVLTKYYFPRVETKTVEVEKDTIKYNITTKTVTVKHPDGTIETYQTVVDHTVHSNTDTRSSTVNSTKNWQISISTSSKIDKLEQVYGLQVQRKILGPLYLGAMIDTNKNVGISLGFEF